MPIYRDLGPLRAQQPTLPQDFASVSDVAGSAAKLGILDSGINRFIGGQVIVPLLGGRTLAPSEAYARADAAGITDIEVPDSGIQEDELTFLINHKTYLNNLRKDVSRTNPDSLAAQAGLLGIGLATGFLDPTSYIPILGPANKARMLSMSVARRAAYRFGRGAAEGTIGASIGEVLGVIGDQRLQNDWNSTTALVNIAGGGLAGGVLSAGGGAIFDLFSKPGVDIGKALDVDTPLLSDDSLNVYNRLDGVSADALSIHQSNANIIAGLKDIVEVLDSLPQSKHFEFVDTALRQMEAGEPVNMTGMVKNAVDGTVNKNFSLLPLGKMGEPVQPISSENIMRLMSRNAEGQGSFSVFPALQDGQPAVFETRAKANAFIKKAGGDKGNYIVEQRGGKYEVLEKSDMFPALDEAGEVMTFAKAAEAKAYAKANGGEPVAYRAAPGKGGQRYVVMQNATPEMVAAMRGTTVLNNKIDLTQESQFVQSTLSEIENLKKGGVKEPKQKPESLTNWIIKQGGINNENPSFRGEVQHVADGARNRPGLINNKRGLALDTLAHRAQEAGFFPGRDLDLDPVQPDDLMEALRRDLSGDRVYDPNDRRAGDWENYLAQKENENQVEGFLSSNNIDINDSLKNIILKLREYEGNNFASIKTFDRLPPVVSLDKITFYRRHRARLVQDVPAGQKTVDAPIATGRSVLQYSPNQEIVKPQRATFRQEPASVAERLDAPLVEPAKIKDSVTLADTTNDALRLRAASLDMEKLSPAMREGVAEALKTIDAGKTLQKRAETTAEIARKYATCLTGIVT